MEFENKRLIRNFLNHKKNKNALLWSLTTLVICMVFSQLYWEYSIGEYLAASPNTVFEEKEYWRLFTSSLIHGDLSHLLSNSIMLSIMGYFVCSHFGTLMYPFFGFFIGIFINLIVIWDYPSNASLVGASGVVHYLWGFWLVSYILIQRHIKFNRRLMKATAVGIFILIPTEYKPQISYYAHGVGLTLGVLTGLIYFVLNKNKIRSYEEWEIVFEEDDEGDDEYEEGWHYLH